MSHCADAVGPNYYLKDTGLQGVFEISYPILKCATNKDRFYFAFVSSMHLCFYIIFWDSEDRRRKNIMEKIIWEEKLTFKHIAQ